MSTGIGIRIAQALGIAGSAWLSGSISSLSIISAPALLAPSSLASPTHATIQWKALYNTGKNTMPPVAVAASAAYFYLAFTLHKASLELTKLYATAGVLTLGIVPYTILIMSGTNAAIGRKAVDGLALQKETTTSGELKVLVGRWINMNLARGLLPLAGTAFAAYAAFF
ncbi:hypothetical protein V5O48_016506 [Marasmius crinis-equi]|uniref:DUF1772-domain-containing protein n=1 Tax=Marasmius crinis-equi TaxID=585013 RepID=A0ABR3ERL2_9AGAR